MNSDTQRTLEWQQKHPVLHRRGLEHQKARKKAHQLEAIADFDKSSFKTPMQAIRAFCRMTCTHPERSRPHGYRFFKAHVDCRAGFCPLHAFRNGNPVLIRRGISENNIAVVHTAQ